MEEPPADENGEQKKMANDEDLSNFERGMVVGARQAGRSVSETAELLGFSHTAIARVYTEWTEKEKITLSSERQQNSAIKDGENVVSEGKTLSGESQVLQTHSDEDIALKQKQKSKKKQKQKAMEQLKAKAAQKDL